MKTRTEIEKMKQNTTGAGDKAEKLREGILKPCPFCGGKVVIA